jgi:hypothetical protein
MTTKKATTHPKRPHHVLEGVSKAALMDIVADAMDAMYGEGDLPPDDGWGYHELVEFCAPRLQVRGDKEPANWKPGILRRL